MGGTELREGWGSEGEVYLDSDDLEMFDDGGEQVFGVRFSAINIPPGAAIQSASISMRVDDTDEFWEADRAGVTATIQAQLAPDTTAGFSEAAFDVSRRAHDSGT